MNDHTIQLISIEAFLRRASQLDMPFMVKGSVITRQFLEDASIRHAADLDFVYMGEELTNVDEARKIFSAWTTQVTELELKDGVRFDSFQENAFWRSIDYAMSDDFPTVNTDLICYLDTDSGEIMNDRLELDISFNLDISCPAEPLIYQPLQGESFWLEYTCPLPLQIAWKLHQTITRPRIKDIFDLIHLFQHESYDKEMFNKTWEALWKECEADGVPIERLQYFVSDMTHQYFLLKEKGETNTDFYKQISNKINPTIGINFLSFNHTKYFLAEGRNPYSKLSDMLLAFKNALNKAGFTEFLFPDFWIQKPAPQPQIEVESNKAKIAEKMKSKISFWDKVKGVFGKELTVTFKLGNNIKPYKMLLKSGMFVSENNAIVKKEISELSIDVRIIANNSLSERIVIWEIIDINQDNLNIEEDWNSYFDNTLKGIKVFFTINPDGTFLKMTNKNDIFFNINENINELIEGDLPIGMSPDMNDFPFDFFKDTFSDIDMMELNSYIESLHKKYGQTYILGKKISQSTLRRKIAKEHIPAIESIKSNMINNIFHHSLKKKMNMDRTMQIFENKDQEAFRPFVKEKLKDALFNKVFGFEEEEVLRYNTTTELIEFYRKAGIYVTSSKKVIDFSSYEIIT